MKDIVMIKSYQNGISLLLKEEASFEELLEEVGYKFRESRQFFGQAKMALSLEGRVLSDEEEMRILDAVHDNSDVNIVCLVGRDEEKNQNYLKALQQMETKISKEGDEGQFYKGTLKNKQVLETESSIVILGDVYPGSAIISAKNIIILGGLYGEAYAGGDGMDEHYIVSLEMEPERLKIGDFKYKSANRQNKWSIRPKVQPKIAYVKNGKIVMEPLTKDLLGSF